MVNQQKLIPIVILVTYRTYARTGLPSLSTTICCRRSAIFGPVARLGDEVPAHKVLHSCVRLSQGRLPDPTWKRRPGHPRGRWIDQLRRDNNRPPADQWKLAIRRGHGGRATLRSNDYATTWPDLTVRRSAGLQELEAAPKSPSSHLATDYGNRHLPAQPRTELRVATRQDQGRIGILGVMTIVTDNECHLLCCLFPAIIWLSSKPWQICEIVFFNFCIFSYIPCVSMREKLAQLPVYLFKKYYTPSLASL